MEAVRAMPQKYRRKNPVLFDLKLTERRLWNTTDLDAVTLQKITQ
jgi:hypothetical protein